MLCDICLTKVAVLDRLKLAEHVQKLVPVFYVSIHQIGPTFLIEPRVLNIFCFHIFVARQLSVSIYQQFIGLRIYYSCIGFQLSGLSRNEKRRAILYVRHDLALWYA